MSKKEDDQDDCIVEAPTQDARPSLTQSSDGVFLLPANPFDRKKGDDQQEDVYEVAISCETGYGKQGGGKNLSNIGSCIFDGIGSEKDPGKHDDGESETGVEDFENNCIVTYMNSFQYSLSWFPDDVIDYQESPVNCSPRDESKVGTMPESRQ